MRIIPNSYGAPREDLREYNPCHEPAGTSIGGQFARKGSCGAGVPAGWQIEQNEGGRWVVQNPDGWRAVYDTEAEARARIQQSVGRRSQRRRYLAAEQLDKAEGQPLPYEPPLGGRPPDAAADPMATDAEMRTRLTEMDVVDEEELGSGINASFKVTLDDGTEAVWKPESGEAWKSGDIDGDDRPSFSVDSDAADNAVSEAVEEGHRRAEQEYVKEARKQWKNEFEPLYQRVLEEYAQAGKLEINPGTEMVPHHRAAFLDALVPSEEPGAGMFTEEGLLDESAESLLRQHLDDIIASGVKAMPAHLQTPDADFFGERSHYFNPRDGLDNWRGEPEAEEIARQAYDDYVERAREEWEEEDQWNDNSSGNYIRGSITNRDFTQAQRDAAAYELDRIVGINTTPVSVVREHNSERGSVMLWADKNLKIEGSADDQTMRGAIFDYLIGNTDRHGGNFIRNSGGLHTIDNGLTFPDSDSELRSMLVDAVVRGRKAISEPVRTRVLAGLRSTNWSEWAERKGMSHREQVAFLDRVNTLLTNLADGDEFWKIAAARTHYWF